jgi:hypothetical protein
MYALLHVIALSQLDTDGFWTNSIPQKRYFVLCDEEIRYFRDMKEHEMGLESRGVIILAHVRLTEANHSRFLLRDLPLLSSRQTPYFFSPTSFSPG